MYGFFNFFFFFFGSKRVCLGEETAKQEGREGREKKKDGVEGRKREESTPKPVGASSHREVP